MLCLSGRFLISIKRSLAGRQLKHQAVIHLGGILRIARTVEAQVKGQGLQVGIGRGVHRVHLLEAALSCGVDEVTYQHCPETTKRPGIVT
jgi:hypothetical protein